MIITSQIAGAGEATAAVVLQERGTTKALAASGTFDLDGTAGTIISMLGNGVGATAAGTICDLNLTFTGTTTTAATIGCIVTWLP